MCLGKTAVAPPGISEAMLGRTGQKTRLRARGMSREALYTDSLLQRTEEDIWSTGGAAVFLLHQVQQKKGLGAIQVWNATDYLFTISIPWQHSIFKIPLLQTLNVLFVSGFGE